MGSVSIFFCHQFPQGSYYWAACKGNAQLINEKQILLSQKKTKWQTEILEDFACPIPPISEADFVGHFTSSGEQIWKWIGNEHKINAWSHWLYIYAEWLSK